MQSRRVPALQLLFAYERFGLGDVVGGAAGLRGRGGVVALLGSTPRTIALPFVLV